MPLPNLLAIPLVMSLSACIAVPIQPAGEEPFKEEKLAFIEIGKTTKEEIAIVMSELPSKKDEGEARVKLMPQMFRGGDWWLYTQTQTESQWLWLFPDPLIGVPTPTGRTGGYNYHHLLIKFDDNGVVAGYEVSSTESDGCNPSGVCRRGLSYMLLASLDEDRDAKQFDIPADQCGVYVYGKPKFAVPIWLDGNLIGRLLDHKRFLFLQLDPGVHQLSPLSPFVLDQIPIEFDCIARGAYFFESVLKRSEVSRHSSWTEIEQRDAVNGRHAVGERELMLSITETAD